MNIDHIIADSFSRNLKLHKLSKKHPAVGGTYGASLLIYNYKEAQHEFWKEPSIF